MSGFTPAAALFLESRLTAPVSSLMHINVCMWSEIQRNIGLLLSAAGPDQVRLLFLAPLYSLQLFHAMRTWQSESVLVPALLW